MMGHREIYHEMVTISRNAKGTRKIYFLVPELDKEVLSKLIWSSVVGALPINLSLHSKKSSRLGICWQW